MILLKVCLRVRKNDIYTSGHSIRVAHLHDLGEIDIADEVLNKKVN
jgi:HD-GYP domain-containing protein (c-di-GMP phosphodiesterase class II)